MTTTAAIPITNPYVGPRSFSYEQRRLFFGREREARDLLSRLLSARLLLFYAQSGAGKTSLLNARLIPQLQEEKGFVVLPVVRVSGNLPEGVAQVDNIYIFNLMVGIDEGENPARLAQVTLSDFLARLTRRTIVNSTGEAHKGWVYDADLQLPAAPQSAGARRYALVIDQFEEIITAHPDRWREREAFFRQLDQAMQDDPNLWVVLALREDYVASLDPYAPFMTDRLRARFYMERMGVESALDAVRKPAEVGGRPFAPGVAETLVDDLRQIRVAGQADAVPGQYVEPVQLQVVCYQLWERLTGDRRQVTDAESSGAAPEVGAGFITEADLAAAGDVDQALAEFYVNTLAAVLADPDVQAAGVTERSLRTWFDKELITVTGIRSIVLRNEGSGRTGSLPNAAVDALGKRFLLRTELRGGGAWVELVHDRFVEPIRASNEVWFAEHLSTLQRAAALWQDSGRAAGLLLADAALDGAVVWAGTHALLPYEQEFLAASLAARTAAEKERKQAARIRILAVIAGAVAVVAIVLAFFAWTSTQRADEQAALAATREAEAIVAKATAVAARSTAESLAVLAKEQAYVVGQQAATVEAALTAQVAFADSLSALLTQVAPTDTPTPEPTPPATPAPTPTRVLAPASNTDPSGSLPLILASQAVLTTWAIDYVATVNADAALSDAIDAASPYAMTLPRHRHTASVLSAAYSLDGAQIVTASADQTARIWIANIDDLLAEAERLIQRDPPILTPEERRRYGLE